jgi:hypothetical protein
LSQHAIIKEDVSYKQICGFHKEKPTDYSPVLPLHPVQQDLLLDGILPQLSVKQQSLPHTKKRL